MKHRYLVMHFCLGMLMLAGTTVFARDSLQQAANSKIDGADVFLTYCAGCHGFEGFAEYSAAPSFSMGDRLYKSDDALLESVLKGKGAMPSWEDKLSVPVLRGAIQYIRIMDRRIRSGAQPRQRQLPEFYFRFRPAGERNPNWWITKD